jgi:hypothetical protein
MAFVQNALPAFRQNFVPARNGLIFGGRMTRRVATGATSMSMAANYLKVKFNNWLLTMAFPALLTF